MEIKPIKSFNKTVTVAPDKSITHRAVMFNAMANGRAVIKNALLGQDCLSTIECMKKLGAQIEVNGNTVTVYGVDKFNSCSSLYVGNSGTTFRLLSGLLAGKDGFFTLDGDGSIRKRPMGRVITPLTKMGANIVSNDNKAPVTITGKALCGIEYEMPVASAQVKSAILLAGLNADGQTTVIESVKSRNHTEIMLKAMGADIIEKGNRVSVKRSKLSPVSLTVPGDISSATYPLVLGAVAGKVTVLGVGVNPTRDGVITVLKNCGAKVTYTNYRDDGEPTADITVEKSDLKPFTIGREIMPYLIDEIPALAVLACFIKGESVITGAEELKVKESNRIDSTVNALKALGADITATNDGMIIRGNGALEGGAVIDSLGDHRIAMSMAVAGALSKAGVKILDAECCAVSYPDFFELFKE
ncbi:MAG: 3-phosphoshikimate 1-carboxyvinyltransferase [Clostridia bacterium]|nr:3-phosphoshikimate 1-carboxyvinyltransferase [Clostridia bacterium]